jgi:hypothetical protein
MAADPVSKANVSHAVPLQDQCFPHTSAGSTDDDKLMAIFARLAL